MVARCAVALLALPSALPAAGPAQTVTDERIQAMFANFDGNGDGSISFEEYETNKVFAFFRSQSGEQPISISYDESLFSRPVFESFDRNGDGTLTGAEIIADHRLQFVRIDQNRDNAISRAEFNALVDSLAR